MRRDEMPAVGIAEMRDVEHWMIEEMGIAKLQMLENTGVNLAGLIIDRFGRVPAVVLAGRGSNGAGGLATARHLANRGVSVGIILAQPLAGMSPTGAHQLETDRAMGLRILGPSDAGVHDLLTNAGIVVDALMGYALSSSPQGETARLISEVLSLQKEVVSLDVPSGTDPDSGHGFEPHISATITVALGVPKRGILTEEGARWSGELYVSDLSIPPLLYERLGYTGPPLFADQPVMRLE